MEKEKTQSSVLKQLIDELKHREWTGIYKYGTTVDREDYELKGWIKEMRQELMDALMYLGAIEKQKMYIVTKENQVVCVRWRYEDALEFARGLATDQYIVRITPTSLFGVIEPSVNIYKDEPA
jgi:hypothetical protein